jgi:hypothetical protein
VTQTGFGYHSDNHPGSVELVWLIPPTSAPTKSPTEAPTALPTAAPTKKRPDCVPASGAGAASSLKMHRTAGGGASIDLLEDGVLRVSGATCLEATLCDTCGGGGGSGGGGGGGGNSKELSPSAWTMVASAKQPSRWPLTVDGQKKLLGFYDQQIDTENWWV